MSDTVLRLLGDSSLRAALVAALVALVLAALRVRSAGARHAAWRAVLCAMLLMPILPYGVPHLPFPLLRSFRSVVKIPAALLTFRQTLAIPPTLESPQAVGVPESTPSRSQPSVPKTSAELKFWPTAALVAYGMGTLILMSRLFLGWRWARRIARGSRRVVLPTKRWAAAPWPSEVPLCESEAMTTPVTVGALQPTTILPLTWRLWPDEKLRAVLTHELAHVRRRDPLVGFLAHINLCFFWFHPLAWWLEHELATTAEHACDDAVVRSIGEPQHYARILIDMAEAVRKSGGRVARQGIGIDGSGLLDRRIDRILRGEPLQALSRLRKAFVASTCGAVILVVAACREQPAPPVPLQPNPRVGETPDRSSADRELERTAREMTPQQVAELEASLKRNPEDLSTLRKLLIFYWKALSDRKAPEDEKGMAARRAHILSLIQNHPESELAGSVEARIFLKGPDGLVDPVGYAQARALWLAHTRRPDVSGAVLGNASRFFETAEKPLAEEMLLRAQTRDPTGPWSSRLGSFYAVVLVGSYAPTAAHNREVSVAEPESPYAEAVRRKLAESRDEVLLTAAAESLLRSTKARQLDFDRELLAKSYLERALELNPKSIQAHRGLLNALARLRTVRIDDLLREVPPISQYETVSALPESERFELLPDIALRAYGEAENAERFGDNNLNDYIQSAWGRSRDYAEDLLELAPKFRRHPRYGAAIYRANMTLGSLALREGDKNAAIECIRRASRAPTCEELLYSPGIAAWPVLTGLLKEGERESVIGFLERMAQTNVPERPRLREWAQEIRSGRMPHFPR